MALNINIDAILELIKTTLIRAYTKESAKVKAIAEDYVNDAKPRLAQLAEGAASGKLSYKFVIDSLKEEETNLKDALISLAEIAGSDLQDLINQTIAIFTTALNAVIKAN